MVMEYLGITLPSPKLKIKVEKGRTVEWPSGCVYNLAAQRFVVGN